MTITAAVGHLVPIGFSERSCCAFSKHIKQTKSDWTNSSSIIKSNMKIKLHFASFGSLKVQWSMMDSLKKPLKNWIKKSFNTKSEK